MSSDPIEVLRELAASWHRAALNCHECGKPSQARVFRECAAQVTSALASLSAPKPSSVNDNAVAVNESAPVNDKPESAEAVGEVVLHDGLLYGRLVSDLPVGSILYTARPGLEASGLAHATVQKVVGALSRLGISAPEGHEEQAARADELVTELCDAAGAPQQARADRMAIRMLVAAGFVTKAKVNEALNIAHGFVEGPLEQASAPVGVEAIREAFDEISGLCRHLRQGGPAPEDLQDLSAALDEAVGIAANMLHALDQQPAAGEVDDDGRDAPAQATQAVPQGWPRAAKDQRDQGWTLEYRFLERVTDLAASRTEYSTSMEATEQVLIAALEVLAAQPRPEASEEPQQASAPVGVEALVERWRTKKRDLSALGCANELEHALAQQPPAEPVSNPDKLPAAVDEAMERLRLGSPRLWRADLVGQQISVERMRDILAFALAGQQHGGPQE